MYNRRQLSRHKEMEQRRQEAFQKIPRLSQIDGEIAAVSLRKARGMLLGGSDAALDLEAEIAQLSLERAALLEAGGFPPDYLAPLYDCPLCRDTGYIDGKKCACFRKAETALLYSQSRLDSILEEENFSHFSLALYADEPLPQEGGYVPRDLARTALQHSLSFVRNFDSSFENLLFYGGTGLGKTFLSHCIAKELLDRSYCVIYFTAFDLFELFARHSFSGSAEAKDAHDDIFNCDLLIIDDLGTELTNSFVSSQLFLCINERILRKKSTIISTNLRMNQMAEIYSERTVSRITSNYTLIRLIGDDIRIKKKFFRRNEE